LIQHFAGNIRDFVAQRDCSIFFDFH
jgi:hypothetical protein